VVGENNKNEKEDIVTTLEKLGKLNDSINSEVIIAHKVVKSKNITEDAEKSLVLNWFTNTCLYEPPHLFFSTMSNEIARSYMPEPIYLDGFKLCLQTILEWLTVRDKHKAIETGLEKLKSIADLHQFYSDMLDIGLLNEVKFTNIFKMSKRKWNGKSLIKNKKIDQLYQLNLIFRGREIKVVKVLENVIHSDRSLVQRLLLDAVNGGIADGGAKVEIVEFKEIKREKKDWDRYYTYALYLPMHGMIGDASGWIVFPRIDGESSWEPFTDFTNYLQKLAKNYRKRVDFKSYWVTEGLLRKYIQKKDRATIIESDIRTKLNDSRGLLAEFLMGFYLSKFYNARLLDVEKEDNDTDIDVIAENTLSLIIGQAKTSLPLDKKLLEQEVNEIIKHFKKVEGSVKTTKQVKKLFFYIMWDLGKNYHDEVSRFGDNDFAYVLNRRNFLESKLKKSNIDIINYRYFKLLLGRDKKYSKLLNKFQYIFDVLEDAEEFLW
jgi:hypothetical protein